MKGTFFFLGENIARYEKDVIEILNRGHHIGNHSYNHPIFARLSLEKARDQVTRTDDIIRNLLAKSNQDPKQKMYFRYPYGSQIKESLRGKFSEFLKSKNLENIFWDVDTNDWRGKSPKTIARIISGAKENRVVLVHDRKNTKKALEMMS